MHVFQNFILIQGVAGAGFEGFRGTLGGFFGGPSGIVVGSVVSVVVDSARSARMRATSGKSLFTETLYVTQIIGYYGIWL